MIQRASSYFMENKNFFFYKEEDATAFPPKLFNSGNHSLYCPWI